MDECEKCFDSGRIHEAGCAVYFAGHGVCSCMSRRCECPAGREDTLRPVPFRGEDEEKTIPGTLWTGLADHVEED
jgi:hypothetical protein